MATDNIKPLILHAHNTGPNPYKAAIIFELLNIPYKVELWEFGDAENGVKGNRFTAINENGRVPAVEDPNTGVVSWESGAVINYLLRVYDKQGKLGAQGKSEQDVVDYDKWIFFLVSTLGPMMGQLNWYRHYNGVENKNALDRYVEQVYRTYDVLEGQLKQSGGKSILAGGFSAVDAHTYPWVLQYSYAQLDISKYPMIKQWLETIGQMKEVKAAYEKIPAGEKA